MSPKSSWRKYGSLEDGPKPQAHRSPGERASVDAGTDRSSFDFDPSLALRRRAKGDATSRWFALVVVGMVAVGVMISLSRAGYRLPKVTRSSTTTGDIGGNQNMVVVGSAADKEEVAALHQPSPREGPIVAPSPSQQEGPLSKLEFTAVNPYHVRDGKPAVDYPWLKDVKLIEPFRETTLSVTSPREGFEYRWVVHGHAPGEAEQRVEAVGETAVVVCTVLDENNVMLDEVDVATGAVVRRLEEKVMVKYVRREIRTLTDDEREELFDAMYTLWSVRVDGGNGKELYGDAYADIFAINRLHFKAASPEVCDHFHDGLGFLTNHAVISNTFEASLQAVNPKLTLPYWDFTIESSAAGESGDDSVSQPQTKSPLFRDSWFGSVDPTDDQVKSGRWAYTEIPQMMQNNPGAVEPDVYSKLRAPWNVNDRPYLTRGMGKLCHSKVDEQYPWPTCEMHYDMVTSYSDFYSWVWYSLYDPHGPVHIWIGGVLDCEKTYKEIAGLVGPERAEELALYSFVHRKNLFRDGIFSCTGTATVKQAPSDILASGQCGCHGYDLTQGDDFERIYNTMADMSDIIGDFDSDVRRQVVAALCTTPMNDGDHLQASSSMDPSFYSAHPTMERLWMYTVLTGQIRDYTWPDSDITITKPDGTTVSESISLYGDTCEGHRGSDVFPFGLLDTDTDGFEIKTGVKSAGSGNILTNRELLQAFDPRRNDLPYVYDTFKWEHCSVDGFDFDDAWSSKKANTSEDRRTQFEHGVKRLPMFNIFKKMRAARMSEKLGTLMN